MYHEDQIRVQRWLQFRHEQYYEKRLIIIRLPSWAARIRRALTGGYGPAKWMNPNDR